MDHISLEERYFTYNKFLDGVVLPAVDISSSALDLSFNDGITAAYLLGKGVYPNILIPTFGRKYNSPNIISLDMRAGLRFALNDVKTDLIISIGGTFNFLPLEDIAFTLYNSLNANGEIILGVYPQIYDDRGVDILDELGKAANITVHKKLLNWTKHLAAIYKRYFPNLEISNLVTDTTAEEVKDIFQVDIVKSYLFKSSDEFNLFFAPLNDSSRLYMFWQVISAKKIIEH